MDNASPSSWPIALGSVFGYGLGFFLGALWAGRPYSEDGFGTFGFAVFIFTYIAMVITAVGLVIVAIINAVLGRFASGLSPTWRGFLAVWGTAFVIGVVLIIWQWMGEDRNWAILSTTGVVIVAAVVSGCTALATHRVRRALGRTLLSILISTIGFAAGIALISSVVPST